MARNLQFYTNQSTKNPVYQTNQLHQKKSRSKQIDNPKKHLVTEHEQITRSLMKKRVFLCEKIQQKEGYAESNLTSNAKFSTLNSKTCRA